jgi:hypothetical protein
MMTAIAQQIDEIEQALSENRYKVGSWQKLLQAVEALGQEERTAVSESISELGNKLHQRHGFIRMPFIAGFLIEIILMAIGTYILVMGSESFLLVLAGSLALILSMQPFLKILTGLVLGVRYAYVFVFYVEPRFKMQYGTYLCLTPIQRIAFHTSGVIGTPLAMLVAIQMLQGHEMAIFWGWVLFWGAVALQLVPFLAELAGLKKVGPFRLAVLTGAATVAAEIKKLSDSRPNAAPPET